MVSLRNCFIALQVLINCISLAITAVTPNYRTELGFGVEPDHFSGLSSSVRCSKSKLSLSKSEALYTWEVDGFLSYLRYLRDFGAKDFVHGATNIFFDSEKINGEWSFEMRSTGQENFITATYVYTENAENENGNFGIRLKIFQPNFESIDLPIQKPTTTVREKIHVEVGNGQGQGQPKEKTKKPSTYLFLYESSEEEITSNHKLVNTVIMTFNWPNIPTDKFLDFQNKNSELTFAFMIYAYFPKEAKHLKKSTCNLENLENKYIESSNNYNYDGANGGKFPSIPILNPQTFSEQDTKAMFGSSKFSDYVIRVENITIPVHGVILYYSSPVLANMILNATENGLKAKAKTNIDELIWDEDESVNNNTVPSDQSVRSDPGAPILDIDSDIGYSGTLEMLRFIYTGEVKNLSSFAHRIILGAERYNLPRLKQICEVSLVTNVNLRNVVSMYILGMDINSSRLVRKAFAVIQANRVHIVSQSEDFRKLSAKYPNLMFELFIS